MRNRGQTTIFFSLMISVLIIFTLTAFEITRICAAKIKIRSVAHSAASSIEADYNRRLFEKYHLLFLDITYGTDSEAALEERFKDYMEASLNGEESGELYSFDLNEVSIVEPTYILDDDMEEVKRQIAEYEKLAGIYNGAKRLCENLNGKEADVKSAAEDTERGATATSDTGSPEEKPENSEKQVDDPRDILKNINNSGLLNFVAPGINVSKEYRDYSSSPSAHYKAGDTGRDSASEPVKDHTFGDIDMFKGFLNFKAKESPVKTLEKKAAFVDYVTENFSNAVEQMPDTVNKCEVEYIIAGKKSDYDNLESVVNEILWMRLPVNYAYILTDQQKTSEALTLATAICIATSTEYLTEVVKYLLLGCWSYGESLVEVRTLLNGGKISYAKTKSSWITDLSNPTVGTVSEQNNGQMSYKDFLMILLALKTGKSENMCYARMLDMIEINIKNEEEKFSLITCVGRARIQGIVSFNPFFTTKGNNNVYEYSFDEEISYEEKK